MSKVYITENKKLEKLYKEDKNNIVLLYANIDSGKEAFIQNFAEDKDIFYYKARDISFYGQKKLFIDELKEFFNIKKPVYNYYEIENYIYPISSKKMVIAIDDFNYMIKGESDILDFIISLYNNNRFNKKLFIILSFFGNKKDINDKEFISHKIYEMIDEKIKLSNVSFLEMVRTFPSFTVEKALETYSIIGTSSSYIEKWDEKLDTKENVINLILNKNGSLRYEAERLLHQELRELSSYNTILFSIAKGNNKLNDIYNDTNFSRAKILVYIKNLMDFDIVEKVVSFDSGGWDNAKKGIYRISNNFINFYFTFIYPNLSKLEVISGDDFYDRYIRDRLKPFMKKTFVKVSYEYIMLLNMMNKMPIKITKMGTWIGKKGTIDIVCQNSIRENIIASCYFGDSKMKKEEYDKLLLASSYARLKPKFIYLFSATDFSDELKNLSKEHKMINLIDMKEL